VEVQFRERGRLRQKKGVGERESERLVVVEGRRRRRGKDDGDKEHMHLLIAELLGPVWVITEPSLPIFRLCNLTPH